MKNVNWFYVSLVVLVPILIWYLQPDRENEISFFGIAENLETEINYNYDVVVDQILVSSGQQVKAGTPLMKISRRKAKEVLEDQIYQIQTLIAEENVWKQKKMNEIEAIRLKKERDAAAIESDILKLENEYKYKKSLAGDPVTKDDTDPNNYDPIGHQITQLQKELVLLTKNYEQQINATNEEISLGTNPYRTRINELEAEKEFDALHKIQNIDVLAPEEGLIGNIYCKEAEHVPAFKTLLTFYEPHSGIIKGYIHENLTLTVKIGDPFMVTSLKNNEISYEGEVIGLGSRIIEVPSRLRKFPQVKSYGREVTIEISKDNIFLQKEKVGLKIKSNESEK